MASKAPITMFSLHREKRGCPNWDALSKTGKIKWVTKPTTEECASTCMSLTWCVEFYYKDGRDSNCMVAGENCGDKWHGKFSRYVINGRSHGRVFVTAAPVTAAPVTPAPVSAGTTAPVTQMPTERRYELDGKFGCKNWKTAGVKWESGSGASGASVDDCYDLCAKWNKCVNFFHRVEGGKGQCMLETGNCENKKHWQWKKYMMNLGGGF
jgi:hypothetical protein